MLTDGSYFYRNDLFKLVIKMATSGSTAPESVTLLVAFGAAGQSQCHRRRRSNPHEYSAGHPCEL